MHWRRHSPHFLTTPDLPSPLLSSRLIGANILTRSMITFGQGLNRAHPNLIKIVDTLEKGDDLKGFTKEVSSTH